MQLFGRGDGGDAKKGNGAMRREIIAFTWPLILTNLLQTLTVTVNMVMVGNLGADVGPTAIAGIGLGGQVVFLAHSIMIAVSAGTIALVARYTGAKEPEKARRVLKQSLFLGLALSVPLTLFGWFLGGDMVGLFGAEPEVRHLGTVYVQIVFLGTTFSFVEFIAGSAMRGAGDTKTPLLVALLTNLVNVVVGFMLIYGELGFPRMGVEGAAVANVLAFLTGAIAYLIILLSDRFALSLRESGSTHDWGITKKVMKIGSPAAMEQILIQIGFLFYTYLIVHFGTSALAAHQIGQRIQSLAFMPGMGFSAAATALVGQHLGARDPGGAEKCGWESSKLSIMVMVGVGTFMFIAAELMAGIFVKDPDTVRLAAMWIRVQALAMPAIGLFFTISGGLRGAGDTRWPLTASGVGIYAVRLPIAIALGIWAGLGVLGAWIGFLIEYNTRALIIGWRFRLGKWKTIKV
ncbi:MAG: MATE family efflux transporter [Methanobacteriota archaeon]